jgi:hypothetical protein
LVQIAFVRILTDDFRIGGHSLLCLFKVLVVLFVLLFVSFFAVTNLSCPQYLLIVRLSPVFEL